MRIKANFNKEQALEYMRSGKNIYLDGYTFCYDELSMLTDGPAVLSHKYGGMKDAFKSPCLWRNLDRAEIDEPSTKDLERENDRLKKEIKAMSGYIKNLSDIVRYALK